MKEYFITLKNSWQQVTLSDFNKIVQIQKDLALENFEKDLKLLTVLTNLTDSDLENLPVTEVKSLINRTHFINQDIPVVPLKKIYSLNGRKYKLNHNIYKLTGAQFVDLTAFLKDAAQIETNLAYIIAILLLPVRTKYYLFNKTEKYSETDLEIIKDDVLKMPFVDVKTISDFFLNIGKSSVETTISYLRTKMKAEMKSALQILNQTQNSNPQLQQQIQTLLEDGTFSI